MISFKYYIIEADLPSGEFNRRTFLKGVNAAIGVAGNIPKMLDDLARQGTPLHVNLSYGDLGDDNPNWYGLSYIDRSLKGVLSMVKELLGNMPRVGYTSHFNGIEALSSADPKTVQQFLNQNKDRIQVKDRVEKLRNEAEKLQQRVEEMRRLGPTRYAVNLMMRQTWGSNKSRPPKIDRDTAQEIWQRDLESAQKNLKELMSYLASNPLDLQIRFLDCDDAIVRITNNPITKPVGSYILHNDVQGQKQVQGVEGVLKAAMDQYIPTDHFWASTTPPQDLEIIKQYKPEEYQKILDHRAAAERAEKLRMDQAKEKMDRIKRRREDEKIRKIQGNTKEPSVRDNLLDQKLGMRRFSQYGRMGGMHQGYDDIHDPVDPWSFKKFIQSVEAPNTSS